MAKIVVIGGGVAGLTAGITLAKCGHDVRLFEKHGVLGGNLTGWDRSGAHIDNCIHWLTGTNPLTKEYALWQSLGMLGNVDVYQADSLFTFDAGDRVSLFRSLNKTAGNFLTVAPEDGEEIKRLIRATRGLTALTGIDPDNTSRKSKWHQKIAAVFALAPYARLTTGELSDRFQSPVMKGFLESLIGRHFTSLALLTVFSTFTSGNGGLPKGGSKAAAKRLEGRFLSYGGKAETGAEVKSLCVENKTATGVRLSDGRTFPADAVVVATDPATAFSTFLSCAEMPRGLKRLYKDPAYKRFSCVQAAFSVKGDLPFTGDCVIPIPERERETLRSKYLILREFSHEPTFAPSGETVLQAMLYANEDAARAYVKLSENKTAYEKRKSDVAISIIRTACGHFKDLENRLTLLDVWTPATYKRFTGAKIGSFMSFVLPKGRLPLPVSPKIKGVKNVFLGTQWQRAPGGLPLAMKAGLTAAKTTDEYLKREERRSRKPIQKPSPACPYGG